MRPVMRAGNGRQGAYGWVVEKRQFKERLADRNSMEAGNMDKFRFVILGAGKITGKFCEAVSLVENCEICAVASKSMERAALVAGKHGIPRYYDNYEEMLEAEKPDGAYIAVTPNDHCRLSLMCIRHKVPVLCEKAMLQDSREAQEVFRAGKENGVFVMEAMWSRFLPAVRKVREWVAQGRIGTPQIAQCMIGFAAPQGKENRFFNPQLGGGAAKDITVYAYEITDYILQQEAQKMEVSVTWGETGVDVTNHISIQYTHTLADLLTTFAANLDGKMVIYGKKGKIELPGPHVASESFLYDEKGELTEHFTDEETKNGFTYEIEEMLCCVREGRLESQIVPWKDTIECAKLFDRIGATFSS